MGAAVSGEVAERSKALRQGRNLFGGVGSNPTLVTFSACDRMAEWSKAPDPSSGLFGGVGSNPTPVICHGEVAEWSKALRSGRSLFGGVGSNPTLTTYFHVETLNDFGRRDC